MLAESSFFLAYFVFSALASNLIEGVGYKQTMVISLLIQALGCSLCVPAARLVSFWLFMIAVFVIGAGMAGLQTSINPYISILGPEETASIRLNLSQAFSSIGGAIAPLVAGTFILRDSSRFTSRLRIAETIQGPYALVAASLLLLGCAVFLCRLPSPAITSAFRSDQVKREDLRRGVLTHRHTVLGAVGVFLYVGVEVGLASIAVNYFMILGVSSVRIASFLVSLYWLGSLVGRILGSWVLLAIRSGTLLYTCGIAASGLLVISMFTSGSVAIWSVVLCGLFNSIMFPNLFTLGIAKLGSLTSKGSGLMITAFSGGAVIPYLLGLLADKFGIQHALALPFACYLFIAYYGRWGSKPTALPSPQESHDVAF